MYKQGIKLEDDGGEMQEVQAANASYDQQMGRCEVCQNVRLDDWNGGKVMRNPKPRESGSHYKN